jgi:hypothetical protein
MIRSRLRATLMAGAVCVLALGRFSRRTICFSAIDIRRSAFGRRSAIATAESRTPKVEGRSTKGDRFWPQWRGPLASGVAPHARPPLPSPLLYGDELYFLKSNSGVRTCVANGPAPLQRTSSRSPQRVCVACCRRWPHLHRRPRRDHGRARRRAAGQSAGDESPRPAGGRVTGPRRWRHLLHRRGKEPLPDLERQIDGLTNEIGHPRLTFGVRPCSAFDERQVSQSRIREVQPRAGGRRSKA